MEAIVADQQDKRIVTALEGLKHPLPQVRSKYARQIGKQMDLEALQALKGAFLMEPNILCKTEMMRSIIAIEEALGLAVPDRPAFEGADL